MSYEHGKNDSIILKALYAYYVIESLALSMTYVSKLGFCFKISEEELRATYVTTLCAISNFG